MPEQTKHLDFDYDKTEAVALDVIDERERQHEKWGEQNHADGTGLRGDDVAANIARLQCQHAALQERSTWRLILAEEVAEAFAESDPTVLRAELVQVAAVAVQWIEALDRRAGVGTPCPDGCGCRKGTTDADSNDCACGGPCCMDPEWGPAGG